MAVMFIQATPNSFRNGWIRCRQFKGKTLCSRGSGAVLPVNSSRCRVPAGPPARVCVCSFDCVIAPSEVRTQNFLLGGGGLTVGLYIYICLILKIML
jgi:hypothetical protein